MYHASDKAQDRAAEAYAATHSLHSAVRAGCEVARDETVQEIVAWLHKEPFGKRTAERVERIFGGQA